MRLRSKPPRPRVALSISVVESTLQGFVALDFPGVETLPGRGFVGSMAANFRRKRSGSTAQRAPHGPQYTAHSTFCHGNPLHFCSCLFLQIGARFFHTEGGGVTGGGGHAFFRNPFSYHSKSSPLQYHFTLWWPRPPCPTPSTVCQGFYGTLAPERNTKTSLSRCRSGSLSGQ
jgi:hypothetical protein